MQRLKDIPRSPTAPPAFTLVEILIVVAIIGLASAVIVPQILATGSMTAQGAARMVIADLIYAQNEAIAHQSPRRVIFDVAHNSYRVADEAGNTIAVNWKGGGTAGNYIMDFAHDNRFQGISLKAVNFNNTSGVEFDVLGSPDQGGTVDLVAGGFSYRITVSPMTGRVTVAPVTGG